jgi:hypothetical protein
MDCPRPDCSHRGAHGFDLDAEADALLPGGSKGRMAAAMRASAWPAASRGKAGPWPNRSLMKTG